MTRGQGGELDAPDLEEGVAAHEKRVQPLAHKRCESRIDLAARAGVEDLNFQPHGASSRLHLSHRGLGIHYVGRIDEQGYASGCGHQLTQEFQALCHQLSIEKTDTCHIVARPGEAGDKTKPDRVLTDAEDDWYRCGSRLGGQRSSSERSDRGNPPANQFGRQLRQSIDLILGPAVFDRHVLTLDVPGLL